MVKKLDILAFGAHPDDVELGCGGTIINSVHTGSKVGIIDLTEGELGTRGNKKIRLPPDLIYCNSCLITSFRKDHIKTIK